MPPVKSGSQRLVIGFLGLRLSNPAALGVSNMSNIEYDRGMRVLSQRYNTGSYLPFAADVSDAARNLQRSREASQNFIAINKPSSPDENKNTLPLIYNSIYNDAQPFGSSSTQIFTMRWPSVL